MIAIIRLVAFGLVALTIVYFIVSIYSRSIRREHLEKKFDSDGIDGDRDAYIKEGMAQYQAGLRRKLILLVYLVPMVTFGVIVYLVN